MILVHRDHYNFNLNNRESVILLLVEVSTSSNIKVFDATIKRQELVEMPSFTRHMAIMERRCTYPGPCLAGDMRDGRISAHIDAHTLLGDSECAVTAGLNNRPCLVRSPSNAGLQHDRGSDPRVACTRGSETEARSARVADGAVRVDRKKLVNRRVTRERPSTRVTGHVAGPHVHETDRCVARIEIDADVRYRGQPKRPVAANHELLLGRARFAEPQCERRTIWRGKGWRRPQCELRHPERVERPLAIEPNGHDVVSRQKGPHRSTYATRHRNGLTLGPVCGQNGRGWGGGGGVRGVGGWQCRHLEVRECEWG